ncbi:MAG: arginine deiminase family protein [Candidatus Krumholzibacteria bacterium]|nr:arginine deiminase family protein [Candidatus Krumholzibacteria bacterium]
MRKTPEARQAIVRGIPATFGRCLRKDTLARIDVDRAKMQHDQYCQLLSTFKITVTRMAADDTLPDCCFVEDPVLVIDDRAIILSMGAPSRAGEGALIGRTLSAHKRVVNIRPPATLEGGDVLRIGTRLYVGLSERSNREGLEALRALVADDGFEVVGVELDNVIHLKAVCSYLGDSHILLCPGYLDESVFADYERIEVPAEEAYGANSLAINGKVLVAEGFPKTKMRIEKSGFETVACAMSEFRKADGGLSCLSVRF